MKKEDDPAAAADVTVWGGGSRERSERRLEALTCCLLAKGDVGWLAAMLAGLLVEGALLLLATSLRDRSAGQRLQTYKSSASP